MIWIGLVLALTFWVVEATLHAYLFDQSGFRLWPREADELWMRLLTSLMFVSFGFYGDVMMARLRRSERERNELRGKLEEALTRVLSGFITVCARCRKIRDDGGGWSDLEAYVHKRTQSAFSHTVCPVCFRKLYPEYVRSE